MVIVERKGSKTKNPVVVAGFPGPGFVGNVAAKHLTMNLDMREIAHVESRLIPPMKLIVRGELRPLNPLKIYTNLKGNLIILTEDTLGATSPAGFWDIARALVTWLREKNAKEVIFLEGVLSSAQAEVGMFVYSNDYQKIQTLQSHGIEQLSDGAISGISAGMIDECKEQRIPWMVLLSSTTDLVNKPDFQAAAAIVEALNKILGINVDTDALREMDLQTRDLTERRGGLLHSFKRVVLGES